MKTREQSQDDWISWDGISDALSQADVEATQLKATLPIDGAGVVSIEALGEYVVCKERPIEKTMIGLIEMLGLSVGAAGRISDCYAKKAGNQFLVRPDTTSRVLSGVRSATPYYMAALAVAVSAFRAALAGEDRDTVKRDAGFLYRCLCAKVVS